MTVELISINLKMATRTVLYCYIKYYATQSKISACSLLANPKHRISLIVDVSSARVYIMPWKGAGLGELIGFSQLKLLPV